MPHQLDLRDKKIIHHLVHNSRKAFTGIAKDVNLSKETVQYRYHQLAKRKIILSTYPEINYQKLGFERFNLLLLLDDSKQEKVDQFHTAVRSNKHVRRVLAYSDKWDVEVEILARDLRQFDSIIQNLLKPYSDIILKKDTEALIWVQENTLFPEIRQMDLKIPKKVKQEDLNGVDKHDLQILQALCKDARISTYKIAQEIALGADAVGLRIKKLEKSGVVDHFTAHLNYGLLQYQRFMFCFDAAGVSEEEQGKFLYFMSQNQYVESVKKLIGNWDVKNEILIKNHTDFHNLVMEIKLHFNSIVRNYETWVVHKEIYFNPFPKVLLG